MFNNEWTPPELDIEDILLQRDEINKDNMDTEHLLLLQVEPYIDSLLLHLHGEEKDSIEVMNRFVFARYREMAFAGRNEATDFEVATRELFDILFGFEAEHVGPQGNTPDVYIESSHSNYCGIIDNKAYSSYSITGDHHRRMVDVYIPRYSNERFPLRFFAYIAGGFGSNISNQIHAIKEETEVSGCAITVDQIIEMINRNEQAPYTHDKIKEIFSVNRRVIATDL